MKEYGNEDSQYVAGLEYNGDTRTNHEIDIEIPASCSSMCANGKQTYTPQQRVSPPRFVCA